MDNGFRDKDTLTRRDCVRIGADILATEDKRRLNGVDRKAYVLDVAQVLFEWVKNGRVANGSADDSFECDFCPERINDKTAYAWKNSESVVMGCERCFEIHGLEAGGEVEPPMWGVERVVDAGRVAA